MLRVNANNQNYPRFSSADTFVPFCAVEYMPVCTRLSASAVQFNMSASTKYCDHQHGCTLVAG
jgi:hypothetical protein